MRVDIMKNYSLALYSIESIQIITRISEQTIKLIKQEDHSNDFINFNNPVKTKKKQTFYLCVNCS